MRKQTLMALLAAVAMVMLVSAPKSAKADDGKEALKFVPSNAAIVSAFNVSRLKTSPLYGDVMTFLQTQADFKKAMASLKADAGFDPTKDIESVTIAVPGDVEKTQNFLIIAKGKFDETKIAAAMQKEKDASGKPTTVKSTHNGTTLYVIKDEGAVAFVGKHAMIGSQAMVKMAIDTAKDPAKSAGSTGAIASLIKANDTSKDMWLSVQLTKDLKKAMGGGGDPILGDLQAVQANLDVKSGLVLNITIKTSKADTASKIVQLAQPQLSQMGAIPDVKKFGLDVVLANLKLEAAGTDVKIALKLNDTQFKDVYNKVKANLPK